MATSGKVKGFSRRQFLKSSVGAIGVLGAISLVPGCSAVQAPGDGSKSAGKAVSIRYMGHFTGQGDTARDRAQKRIADLFKEKRPEITIEWEETPWQTIGEKFMLGWKAGTAPDISLFSPANIATSIRIGSLENLTPSFDSWPAAEKSDLSKAWWDTGTVEGKKYIAPVLLFGQLPMYRKSIFEAAGYKIDQIRSWKQWVEALQKIVKDGAGRNPTDPAFDSNTVKLWGYQRTLARGATAEISELLGMTLERAGRQVLEPPDWKADFWTSDVMVESFQFMTDLVTKYKVQPKSSLSFDGQEAPRQFVVGFNASYSFGTHMYVPWREKMQYDPNDAVFARWPTWAGDKWGVTLLNHWSMGMSSKSKNKDAAFQVFDHWMSKEADFILCEEAGQQPKRASNVSNKLFDKPDFSFVKLFDQALREWSVPIKSAPVREHEILNQAYHEIVGEGTPAKKALEKARDEYNKLIAEIPKEELPTY